MSKDNTISVARAFSGGPLYKVPKPGDNDFIGPVHDFPETLLIYKPEGTPREAPKWPKPRTPWENF